MKNKIQNASKYLAVIVGCCILIPALAFVFYRSLAIPSNSLKKENSNQQDIEILKSPQSYEGKFRRERLKKEALNGEILDMVEVPRPFAVVVDNHPQSRPQYGLSQADIVYEALTEGGITRFLAIFQTKDVAKIGPVRSVRTYFNDWAQELGAIFAHVGGNGDALYYLHKGIPGISDADEFFNSEFYWRSQDSQAPHNVYTSTSSLSRLARSRKFSTQADYEAYIFKDDQPSGNPSASIIKVEFSTPQFAASWKYDPALNSYKRLVGKLPDIDGANRAQIRAKNVIVQAVKNWPTNSDTPLAISMGTRQGGETYIFMDGKAIKGQWKHREGRTKFYSNDGAELALNRGSIWIEIVPPELVNSLTYQ